MTAARISPIYSRGPAQPADDAALHAQAARAYRESGGRLILINLDRLESDIERDAARYFGKRIYGEVR